MSAAYIVGQNLPIQNETTLDHLYDSEVG